MATISTGLYRITVRFRYLTEIYRNVWWYYETGGDDDATSELALAFDPLVDQMALMLNDSTDILTGKIFSVFSGMAEEFINWTATVGALVGDPMPSYVAMSIRLNRTETVTRNGWKRFVGINEESVTDNDLVGTALTELQDLAALVDDDISNGAFTFSPCIVRTPVGGIVAPVTINDIASGTALSRMTTQNTRKQF